MWCCAGRGAAVGVAPLAFVSLDRLLGEALCRGRSPGGVCPGGAMFCPPWGAYCLTWSLVDLVVGLFDLVVEYLDLVVGLFGLGGIAFQTNILALNALVPGLWPLAFAAAWFELLPVCLLCWPPAGPAGELSLVFRGVACVRAGFLRACVSAHEVFPDLLSWPSWWPAVSVVVAAAR